MANDYKHIVITGASSGIGEALALAYARDGIILSLTGRNEERLDQVAKECRLRGADTHHVIIDVSDRQAMEVWLLAQDEISPVDLIIANAGISAGTGGDGFEIPDQARRLFNVNVTGVLNTIDPLLSRMMQRASGHIAIMSSLAGYRGMPGAPAYCASKAAVKIYGESLRGMLSDTCVDVSVICPGFVKSRMTDQNDFKMPFLVPTDKAAAIIIKGLQNKKGRISFPFPLNFFVWFLSILPDAFAHNLLKNAPHKKPLDL